jgi:hypothetical protein
MIRLVVTKPIRRAYNQTNTPAPSRDSPETIADLREIPPTRPETIQNSFARTRNQIRLLPVPFGQGYNLAVNWEVRSNSVHESTLERGNADALPWASLTSPSHPRALWKSLSYCLRRVRPNSPAESRASARNPDIVGSGIMTISFPSPPL